MRARFLPARAPTGSGGRIRAGWRARRRSDLRRGARPVEVARTDRMLGAQVVVPAVAGADCRRRRKLTGRCFSLVVGVENDEPAGDLAGADADVGVVVELEPALDLVGLGAGGFGRSPRTLSRGCAGSAGCWALCRSAGEPTSRVVRVGALRPKSRLRSSLVDLTSAGESGRSPEAFGRVFRGPPFSSLTPFLWRCAGKAGTGRWERQSVSSGGSARADQQSAKPPNEAVKRAAASGRRRGWWK
jgi:hypothetical protein